MYSTVEDNILAISLLHISDKPFEEYMNMIKKGRIRSSTANTYNKKTSLITEEE